MLLDARKVMVGAQQNERKALVVAQQDVVRLPIALDELRLEKQRLRIAGRRDDFHRPRLCDHALYPMSHPRELSIIGHAYTPRLAHPPLENIAARLRLSQQAGPKQPITN